MKPLDTTHQVTAKRAPNGEWKVRADRYEGVGGRARTLAALDSEARYSLALELELPAEQEPDLVLEWKYETGSAAVDAEAEQIRQLRVATQQALAHVQRRTEALVGKLDRQKWAVRDTAVLVGLTHQRVSQLLKPVRDESTKIN